MRAGDEADADSQSCDQADDQRPEVLSTAIGTAQKREREYCGKDKADGGYRHPVIDHLVFVFDGVAIVHVVELESKMNQLMDVSF